MQDIILGLLAITVGVVVGFRGYLAMRVIIPIWGAFAGFMLGSGLVAAFTDEGFLRTSLAWAVGFAVAVLVGAFAYLYYEVSVVIAMASVGFTIGTSAMVAIGTSWSWLIVIVGALVGLLLAILAIVADLPTILLMALTAIAGSTMVVFGAMLLFGVLETADFESAAVTERIEDDWWWYTTYVALIVAGLLAQMALSSGVNAKMREEWRASGSTRRGPAG